jgi:mannose-6-phosphate isomerase-like protein (cupin superfamily)
MIMTEVTNFDNPKETRTFNNGRIEFVDFAGRTFGRATFEPGWSWENDVKPIAGTETCQTHHVDYVVSGHLHVVQGDQTYDLNPGDLMDISPGHTAWVVGDEPFVSVSLLGEGDELNYAKPSESD